MKKIIIAVVIAVIVVGGAAAVYFFVLSGENEKPEVRVEYSPGDFFTTNVDGSTRILKATIVLVVDSEKLTEKLEENNARIRDTIIFILRSLTEEEIRAQGTQDRLRERIITALNDRLAIDNFVEVLFNDFVMS